jgi:hypothetical protein
MIEFSQWLFVTSSSISERVGSPDRGPSVRSDSAATDEANVSESTMFHPDAKHATVAPLSASPAPVESTI